MKLRDRTKEFRRVKASEILPNPANWRTHPKAQQDALRGILAEVGIADALLVRETDAGLQLIDGHLRDGSIPVTPESPPRPRYLYACTKVFLESLGEVYARQHGITVLAVRLGWCPRNAEHVAELTTTPRGHNSYLSPNDAGRFFVRAVEAALEPGFTILFVTSRPKNKPIFDLEPTKRLLGWEPLDTWPDGATEGIEP